LEISLVKALEVSHVDSQTFTVTSAGGLTPLRHYSLQMGLQQRPEQAIGFCYLS